jgi:hypothetical protein
MLLLTTASRTALGPTQPPILAWCLVNHRDNFTSTLYFTFTFTFTPVRYVVTLFLRVFSFLIYFKIIWLCM